MLPVSKQFDFHASCWAVTVNAARLGGQHERTTRERRHQVHDLLGKGVGLPEYARRPDVAGGTVKRSARMQEPVGDRRAPTGKPTLLDPCR